MKTKILLALLSLVLCLTLFSCAENEPAETTPAVTTEAATPEATPEVTTEAATPEASPEVTTEAATPEATPEVTTEAATPEATPEVTPEETPDATPDATPDITPEVTTPTVTPEATTPAITPDATPESTPAITPESTPVETPNDTAPDTPPETEPNEELTLLERLDAICREQIVLSGGDKYDRITNYYGEIDLGHVFQVYIDRTWGWDSIESETIGDYYFGGYYGDSTYYIYIYDGEKLIRLPNAYEDGLITDADVGVVFHKWLEVKLIEQFKYDLKHSYDQDYSERYDILGVELVTVSSEFITYSIKVAPKDSDGGLIEAENLKLGEYEFANYGAEAFLYTYVMKLEDVINNKEYKVYVGMIYTLKNAYKTYIANDGSNTSKLDTSLPTVYEYWIDTFGGK